MFTHGYAYNLVVFISEKFYMTASELIQRALNIIQNRCAEDGFIVNSNKVGVVFFINRKRLDGFSVPSLCNVALKSRSVKY